MFHVGFIFLLYFTRFLSWNYLEDVDVPQGLRRRGFVWVCVDASGLWNGQADIMAVHV